MDGGHYGYRTPGSPRHWGEEVPGNVPKLVGTGNGSPCGIMVYEGDLLPEEYHGGVLEAEAGTRQINFFPITRQGAAFRTEYKVFLASDDPWFRPVDVTAAPDGSVFVADWYDAGVGGHAFRDQTTGRIYRVAPKGHEGRSRRRPTSRRSAGLIAALKSPVVATQDAARRGLIDARAKEASRPARRRAASSTGDADRAWPGPSGSGTPIDGRRRSRMSPLPRAVDDRDPRIREQAVRILGRDVSRERQGRVHASPRPSSPPPRLEAPRASCRWPTTPTPASAAS